MKKIGFTLTEVLVTMGIIGIIAAITAPAISGIMPDRNKAKVIKAYNNLARMNKEMLEEPGLFTEYIVGNTVGLGFADPVPPADKDKYPPQTYAGTPKYGLILATKMEIKDTPTIKTNGAKFETIDGMTWDVTTTFNTTNNGKNIEAISNIVIDVDPNSANNCYYGQSGCKTPDIFKFNVDTWGGVTGGDPLTKAYLLNPTKLNDKKADYAKAKTLN